MSGEEGEVWQVAAHYRDTLGGSVVVVEDNYGEEGSSREHAAMEPRYLGVKWSWPRVLPASTKTNLKAGTAGADLANAADYDKVKEGDCFNVACSTLAVGQPVEITVCHTNGTQERIMANHTYNETQIKWF